MEEIQPIFYFNTTGFFNIFVGFQNDFKGIKL